MISAQVPLTGQPLFDVEEQTRPLLSWPQFGKLQARCLYVKRIWPIRLGIADVAETSWRPGLRGRRGRVLEFHDISNWGEDQTQFPQNSASLVKCNASTSQLQFMAFIHVPSAASSRQSGVQRMLP